MPSDEICRYEQIENEIERTKCCLTKDLNYSCKREELQEPFDPDEYCLKCLEEK